TPRRGIRVTPSAIAPKGPTAVHKDAESWRVMSYDSFRGPRSPSGHAVEGEVEQQNVDARLAQDTELPALDLGFDQLADARLVELPRLRDPGHLVERGRRADVRVEPASRGGHEVDGDWRLVVGICPMECVDPCFRGGMERGIQRTVVGAGRGSGVVGEWSRRGEPAPEILRIVERLADEARADRLAVPHD